MVLHTAFLAKLAIADLESLRIAVVVGQLMAKAMAASSTCRAVLALTLPAFSNSPVVAFSTTATYASERPRYLAASTYTAPSSALYALASACARAIRRSPFRVSVRVDVARERRYFDTSGDSVS